MSVCCECCVLSGRGLCDGLIIRPRESYRLWRVMNEEAPANWGGGGAVATKTKKLCTCKCLYVLCHGSIMYRICISQNTTIFREKDLCG
jgi:hypothetical protein